LTDADRVRIAQRYLRQIGRRYADDRQVAIGVVADDVGAGAKPIGQRMALGEHL
jgi:hypothetical protein